MNKKGFTLIELLAVLLILAVIALITTPIILNVITNSKENAFIQSASGLVESIRNYQAEHGNNALTVDYTKGDNTNLLNIDGSLPDGGQITINEEGKVKLALWNKELQICVTKGVNDVNDKEITKEKASKENCKLNLDTN